MFAVYFLRALLPIALFIIFLIFGVLREELTWKGVSGFASVFLAALSVWIYLDWPPYLFSTFLIVLDIILLFKVFKGDVTIR